MVDLLVSDWCLVVRGAAHMVKGLVQLKRVWVRAGGCALNLHHLAPPSGCSHVCCVLHTNYKYRLEDVTDFEACVCLCDDAHMTGCEAAGAVARGAATRAQRTSGQPTRPSCTHTGTQRCHSSVRNHSTHDADASAWARAGRPAHSWRCHCDTHVDCAVAAQWCTGLWMGECYEEVGDAAVDWCEHHAAIKHDLQGHGS